MKTQALLTNFGEKALAQMKEILNLKTDIKNLSQELHDCRNQLQRQIIEISTLKKTQLELEHLLNEHKATIQKLENLIAECKASKEALETRVTELNQTILGKDECIKTLNKDIEGLKLTNENLETKNAELLSEIASGKEVVKEYEAEIQRLNGLFEQKKKVVTRKKN